MASAIKSAMVELTPGEVTARTKIEPLGSECADTGGCKKKPRRSEREMTTPLFMLRCVQLGISIRDLDLLTIGLVNDMFTESANDDYPYKQLASQADMDKF